MKEWGAMENPIQGGIHSVSRWVILVAVQEMAFQGAKSMAGSMAAIQIRYDQGLTCSNAARSQCDRMKACSKGKVTPLVKEREKENQTLRLLA